MNKQEKDKLASDIVKHRDLYYNKDPKISDREFDSLVDLLKKHDPDNSAITDIGAPVPSVSEWKKATHKIPMGSLEKALNPEEISEWIKATFNPENSVFITEKLDGISIELIYEKGELISALTRGSGLEGEEILSNVRRMQGVKTRLPIPFTGSLRGEIILTHSDHKKYFPDTPSPRNTASGTAKRFDGKGCEHLTVLFYQAIGNQKLESEFLQFHFIESELKLRVPYYDAYAYPSLEKKCEFVISKWEEFQSKRSKLGRDLDGLVIRVNDLQTQKALGFKHNRPVGAIAFKFRSEETETVILGITPQTGSTGRITPVAEVKPVNLAGATISRSTLYNFPYIEELGLDVGATVLISRQGDIIPAISKVVKSTNTVYKAPSSCVICHGPVEFRGEHLMCVSTDRCSAQKVGRIANWISGLSILEWGSTLIERLVSAGSVSTVADLYALSTEDLEKIERMGSKSAQKCYDSLWAKTEIPLEKFLGNLSIPFIGELSIKLLINNELTTLNDILDAPMEKFSSIKGFGSVKARSLYEGLKNTRHIIDQLLKVGIKVKESGIMKGKLQGKSFCFSGKMERQRKELQAMVETNGGENKSGVGVGLSFLVIDNPASATTKAQNARKFGTTLLSEQEFLAMVGE